MKISNFSYDIISNLLKENPDIMDSWLQKLHSEYIKSGENCKFEDDLSICFHIGKYEIFERNKEHSHLLCYNGIFDLGAGVMLAASYWSLLSPTLELSTQQEFTPWTPVAIEGNG